MKMREMGSSAWKSALAVALLGAGVLVSAGSAAADGTPVYSQPASFPSGAACPCYTSSLDTTGFGFQTFDNFTLGTTTSIGGMTWQGLYLDLKNASNNPVPPDTNTWVIAIYANSGVAPTGSPLFEQTELASSVSTTLAGQDTTDFGVTTNVYNFDMNFGSSFTAVGGTNYWVSVISEQTNFNPLFSWTLGSGGDGRSYQCNDEVAPTDCVLEFQGDRAFTLTSGSGTGPVTGMPEPSSLLLLGSGVFAVMCGFRRRRLADPR